MSQFLLYVIVFLGGACVLSLEILGTRILGPFYGVSLFLWSALITVTLAALSLGYALGGRWADQGPRYSRLALMLGLAGIWLLAVPWVKHPILQLVEPLGLRVAVLLAASLLFFVPLVFLGMVSPYAIRLKAERLGEVGRTAGNLYAVSTLASVLSALVTGFLLIPSMGVNRLTLLLGAVLLVGAALALLARERKGIAAAAPVLVLGLVAAGAAWALPFERARPKAGLLEVEQSPYAEIRVVDWDNYRLLLIDGGGHSIVEPGTWKTHYPYAMVMDINKFFFKDPGRMALVGLGGGSIVKSFDQTGWKVDVVEIDPVVVDVAHRYFGIDDSECDIYTQDGRQYFLTHDTTYDLVILDAFGSSSIPFHLVTEEAFSLIRSRMSPDGVLAINIEADGWYDVLTRSLAATLGKVFDHVIALPLAEPRNHLGNLVLMASNRELEFSEEMLGRPFNFLDDEYLHWTVVTRNHAWNNRFEPDTEGVPVLTDDRNPVDLWAERINLKARRMLHKSFEWKDLAW